MWVLMFVVSGCGEGEGGDDAGAPDGAASMDSGLEDAGAVTLCAADTECDDGRYCNGAERCLPGTSGAAADGCVPGDAPCDAAGGEVCDEAGERCDAAGCEGDQADLDGDGDARPECGGADCDDSDPNIYSTATEICDPAGVDEDCDPSTIRDGTPGSTDGDADGDGYISRDCVNVRPDGSQHRGDDCDDSLSDVHPGVLDGCGGWTMTATGRSMRTRTARTTETTTGTATACPR